MGLSGKQSIAAVVVIAIAIVGWIVAFTYQQQIYGLQRSLTTVENEQSTTAQQHADLQSELASMTAAAARLEEVELALDEYKTAVGDLEGVNAEIEYRTATLASLTPELEASTAQLAALQDKVEALEVQAVVYEAFTGGGPFRFQTSGNVNVRTGPSTDSDVLVVLPPGTDVEVFEAVDEGQWYKIGGVGYIFHDLVQPSPPAE